MRLSFLAVLALATFALAQSPDSAPVVVVPRPEPAKWLELTGEFPLTRLAVPGDKPGKWELVDTENAEIDTCEAGKKASLVVRKEGRYRILLTTDAGTVRLAVTVGKAPDVPPPAPVDPLIARLQAAYTADTGPAKATELKVLVALYSGAVDLVNGASPPASVADLLARLRASATTLGVKNLDAVRKCIADELKAVFPADSPWSPDVQARAVLVLTRVRDALKQVK